MNTEYSIIRLIVALNIESTQQLVGHGKITAVTRYRTTYLISKRDPVFIFFVLGNNIFYRCVLELFTLVALGDIIYRVKS